MVEVSSTCPSGTVKRRSPEPQPACLRHRRPKWSSTRSAPNKPRSDFIARRERIPGSCRENEDAREPFLSLPLGTALPIMTLLAPSSRSDLIRSREISRPSPVKAGGPCSLSVHLGSVSHVFRPENVSTVQATGKRANRQPPQLTWALFRPGSLCRATARRDCAARLRGATARPTARPTARRDCVARHSSRPGLASGGVVPARSGRSARWLAVPSRCPTRDARPRRGP